jgi:hypothetical protein
MDRLFFLFSYALFSTHCSLFDRAQRRSTRREDEALVRKPRSITADYRYDVVEFQDWKKNIHFEMMYTPTLYSTGVVEFNTHGTVCTSFIRHTDWRKRAHGRRWRDEWVIWAFTLSNRVMSGSHYEPCNTNVKNLFVQSNYSLGALIDHCFFVDCSVYLPLSGKSMVHSPTR